MTGSCFQQSHKSDIAHIWQINPETDVIQLIHDGDTNYQLGGRCTVTRWYLRTKFLNSMRIIEESRHPLTKSDPWGSRQIIRMNHRTWCKKFPRVELEGAKPSLDRSISSDRDGGGGRWCKLHQAMPFLKISENAKLPLEVIDNDNSGGDSDWDGLWFSTGNN